MSFRLEIPWCAAEVETLARYSVANLDRWRFIRAVHDLGGWEEMPKRWRELLHLGVRRGGWAHSTGIALLEESLAPLRYAAIEALRWQHGIARPDALPALEPNKHVRIRAFVMLRPRHPDARVGARGLISADALAPAIREALRGIVYHSAEQVREIHVRTQPGPADTERDTWSILVEECAEVEIPSWATYRSEHRHNQPVNPVKRLQDRPSALPPQGPGQKKIRRRRF